MSWGPLDYLVVALIVAEVLFTIGVILAVRTLLAGAKRTARRVGVVAQGGVALAETGKAKAAALTAGAQAVAARARSLKDSARFPDAPDGFLITPASLKNGAAMALTARRLIEVARKRRLPEKKARRRSIPDRLGLVPPIFNRLGWLRTVTGFGWSVLKELRAGR